MFNNYWPDKINTKFKIKLNILIILIIFFTNVNFSFAFLWTFILDDEGHHETSIELNPYYSNVDYVFSLTDKPIEKIELSNESDIYLHMFKNFYKPRYVLLEASINPLPTLGAYIKEEHTEFYNNSEITSRYNIIKSLTDGFVEPYAFSFFFGNVADFVTYDPFKFVGKGYSGFLCSSGNHHILNNTIVKDNWYEIELKLKGSDLREKHSLSWSYAIGTKLHRNENIKNIIYFSIKRKRIDYQKIDENIFLDFFRYNSQQELRIEYDQNIRAKRNLTRWIVLFGKNYPIAETKTTFSLSIGALRTLASGYTGNLDNTVDSRISFIIRPNIDIKF